MRARQHVENLNRAILILDGFGHSGDYERLITVLGQILDDLQSAAEFIDRTSSRNAHQIPTVASVEHQNNDERSPHTKPAHTPPDCPATDDAATEKVA